VSSGAIYCTKFMLDMRRRHLANMNATITADDNCSSVTACAGGNRSS